jgi:hypothetical protein
MIKNNTKTYRQEYQHKIRQHKILDYYLRIEKLKNKTLTSDDKTLIFYYIEKIRRIELLL